jgi:DNA-binding LacI/PurR family transcriptional regulator
MAKRQRTTTRDVAEAAGVSRTTVSFVLNNVPGVNISAETRQRVLTAAEELAYHPDATARRLASGKTHVLGLVVRQTRDQVFADQLLPELLAGVSGAAGAYGFHVLFQPIPPADHQSAYAPLIRERHVDGLLIFGPRSDDEELTHIHAEGAPIVLIGQLPGATLPFVDVDNVGGAELATRHLINQGHRRVAIVTNAPLAYTASADRLRGYRQALEAAGLAYSETLVRYGEFTPASGEQALESLLALAVRPTAVFVASDVVAVGALRAIHRHNLRVPQDIALVGFDDIQLAEFVDPPLTTVRLPMAGLGWGAAELLIRLIANDEIANPYVILPTELVVRRSCGAELHAPPGR